MVFAGLHAVCSEGADVVVVFGFFLVFVVTSNEDTFVLLLNYNRKTNIKVSFFFIVSIIAIADSLWVFYNIEKSLQCHNYSKIPLK